MRQRLLLLREVRDCDGSYYHGYMGDARAEEIPLKENASYSIGLWGAESINTTPPGRSTWAQNNVRRNPRMSTYALPIVITRYRRTSHPTRLNLQPVLKYGNFSHSTTAHRMRRWGGAGIYVAFRSFRFPRASTSGSGCAESRRQQRSPSARPGVVQIL